MNQVELIRVTGHCEIDGNKIPDQHTKPESSRAPIGQTSIVGNVFISSWIEQHDDSLYAERLKALRYPLGNPEKSMQTDFIFRLNRKTP